MAMFLVEVSKLVFCPSQPLGIISGLKTNSYLSLSYSAHKSLDTNHNISTAQLRHFTKVLVEDWRTVRGCLSREHGGAKYAVFLYKSSYAHSRICFSEEVLGTSVRKRSTVRSVSLLCFFYSLCLLLPFGWLNFNPPSHLHYNDLQVSASGST